MKNKNRIVEINSLSEFISPFIRYDDIVLKIISVFVDVNHHETDVSRRLFVSFWI